MGEDEKIRILNRDKEDPLPETEVGDGPLNRKLAEKLFHPFSVQLEGDDSRSPLPFDGDREKVSFGQRSLEKIDGDRMFLLKDISQKGPFFNERGRGPSPKKISLRIVEFDRGD